MRSWRTLLACLAGLQLSLAYGCADPFEAAPQADGGNEEVSACTKEGALQCQGSYLKVCKESRWETQLTCTVPEVCSATLGRCAACEPDANVCVGDEIHTCDAQGKVGALVQTCSAGKCQAGGCTDACGRAAASRSYVGCEYWPTVTMNDGLAKEFTFAVVVANAQNEPAVITVSSAKNPNVATAAVAPGSLATVVLPWVDSLKNTTASLLEPNGAYHLVSSVPVSVYQFNALDYVVGGVYSYTNDASLLLPEHALQREYMVISRPTHMVGTKQILLPTDWGSEPGFFSVVAPKAGTTTVQITFSAPTQAGTGGGLASYAKGQTATFTLQRHGVLQIASQMPASCTPASSDSYADYCDLSATTDLTGTTIRSDQDVAVFAGHACTFIPYNKWACDHLEEQMFPTKSWGKRYLLSHTDSSGVDPNFYRIVSAEDGNQVTFTPASVHAPVTLGAGQWLEIATGEDFEVSGTGRLGVAQFMASQDVSEKATEAPGDPSMALAVPVEQYRSDYRFLAPESYQQNYVNVIAPTDATITLDGQPVAQTEFKQLGAEFKVAKLKIKGGAHLATSSKAFGIEVYGVGTYTSYMYPGGLDLKILLD